MSAIRATAILALGVVLLALSGCLGQPPEEFESSEFKVTVPKGWEVNRNPGPSLVVEFIGPEDDELRASIGISETVEVESIDSAIALERSQLLADGFEIVKENEYTTYGSMVSGRAANSFYTRNTEQGHEVTSIFVIVMHEKNKIRMISFSTMRNSDNASGNNRAFSDMLRGFEWYD